MRAAGTPARAPAPDALPLLGEVRAVLAGRRGPRPAVEGLALPGVEHRHAGEHHAAHLAGPAHGEFGRHERAASGARAGPPGAAAACRSGRRRRPRTRRPTAPPRARRIRRGPAGPAHTRCGPGRVRRAAGGTRARSAGSGARRRAARARRSRRWRGRRCARAAARSGSPRTSCGDELSRAGTSSWKDRHVERRCGSKVASRSWDLGVGVRRVRALSARRPGVTLIQLS